MIKYVVLSLCDNDFGYSLINYMETIKRVLEHDPEMNKEKLEKLIWEGLMFHVFAYNNHYDNYSERDYNKLKTYFENNMKILFNDEAMTLAMNWDHDGGSCYLDVMNGQVGSF